MKYQLTKKDIKAIANIANTAQAFYLKKTKDQVFNVGDILNKVNAHIDENTGELISSRLERYPYSEVSTKYLVIAVDTEANINYIKFVKEDGTLSEHIEMTWQPAHCGYSTLSYFEVDSGTVDAILLGSEFDISQILQEEKDRKCAIVKLNKKKSVVLNTLKQVNNFMEQVTIGTRVYYHSKYHSDYLENSYRSFTVSKKRKFNTRSYSKSKKGARMMGMFPKGVESYMLNDKYLYYLGLFGADNITSVDLIGYAVYLEEPTPFLDNDRKV